ncbi:hypothetical protein BC832DRAFT_251320 [Gaertneriomyces semiglobifer]|nr:hypothetical protein BC832DRAFT_251320 [Gaertneriomyces semiglobifer]
MAPSAETIYQWRLPLDVFAPIAAELETAELIALAQVSISLRHVCRAEARKRTIKVLFTDGTNLIRRRGYVTFDEFKRTWNLLPWGNIVVAHVGNDRWIPRHTLGKFLCIAQKLPNVKTFRVECMYLDQPPSHDFDVFTVGFGNPEWDISEIARFEQRVLKYSSKEHEIKKYRLEIPTQFFFGPHGQPSEYRRLYQLLRKAPRDPYFDLPMSFCTCTDASINIRDMFGVDEANANGTSEHPRLSEVLEDLQYSAESDESSDTLATIYSSRAQLSFV